MTLSPRDIEAAARAMEDKRAELLHLPLARIYNELAESGLTAALAVDGLYLLPNLAKFLAWAMTEGPFDGHDLDGASVQDKAEELGLIIKTSYDPARHGNRIEAWEGCDWFEVAPEITTMLAAAYDGEERK